MIESLSIPKTMASFFQILRRLRFTVFNPHSSPVPRLAQGNLNDGSNQAASFIGSLLYLSCEVVHSSWKMSSRLPRKTGW